MTSSEFGREREQDHDIKQDRQLELVMEGVADLKHAWRPVWLAQGDLLPIDLARPDRLNSEVTHPEEKHECQHDLSEHRQQNSYERHGAPFCRLDPAATASAPRAPLYSGSGAL